MICGMELASDDRAVLESLLRDEGYDGSLSARARIVLWRADGHSASEIAGMAGTTKPTVYKWIRRYELFGVDGLSDWVSSGRPPEISAETRGTILALSRQSPPGKDRTFSLVEPGDGALPQTGEGNLGVTQFHSRPVARARSCTDSPGEVQAVGGSAFEEKVIDVVGLYLDPPMDAVVFVSRRENADSGAGQDPAAAADDLRQDREAHP